MFNVLYIMALVSPGYVLTSTSSTCSDLSQGLLSSQLLLLLSDPFLHFHVDGYDLEGYNPELPGLTGPGRQKQYRHFIPRVQTQRTNLIGLTSGEGQSSRGKRTSA